MQRPSHLSAPHRPSFAPHRPLSAPQQHHAANARARGFRSQFPVCSADGCRTLKSHGAALQYPPPVEFPAQVRMPEGKAADFCALRTRVSLRGTSADRGGATPGLRSLQSLDRATHASAPSELSLLTASGSLPSSYQNQEKSVNRPWQSLPHSSTRVRGNPPPPTAQQESEANPAPEGFIRCTPETTSNRGKSTFLWFPKLKIPPLSPAVHPHINFFIKKV